MLGKPSEAPFDRILVSAAAEQLPRELLAQLGESGTMVVPIQDAICRIEKRAGGKVTRACYPGFAFVPLITREKHV